ncbi:MAG: protein-L-isoaspartate(D-aspartate) O-methyltransferase [Candidatus Omnitrophica bacterium]|nr:protein-L-isoaspartate(D-aspartate) O-methyltransferase [Candidatus Omnitrophota bacterium]
MDFAAARKKMVEEQLKARGISNQRVLDAFCKVERHRFVAEEVQTAAYEDFPIALENGQTISQPYMVALMTELLTMNGTETVLEIGTGSGYQTAILAELAKQVYSIERFANLTAQARQTLDTLGYTNILLRVGDGTLGWQEAAPFDRIIITAASPRIPLPLTDQLREQGLLIAPLGEQHTQTLTVTQKKNNFLETKEICGCVFVPLVGKYGFH